MADIDEHPGTAYFRALMVYERSKDVLYGNMWELRELIAAFESGRLQSKLGHEDFRTNLKAFDTHVIRCLHNFLASVMSLVDHTRVLRESSFITGIHRERVRLKIREVFHDREFSSFIQRLRNYSLHYTLPTSIHTLKVVQDSWEIYIDTKAMLQWDGWTQAARAFLNRNQPKMRLREIVERYEPLVKQFHEWFVLDYAAEHSAIFDSLDECRREFNARLNS